MHYQLTVEHHIFEGNFLSRSFLANEFEKQFRSPGALFEGKLLYRSQWRKIHVAGYRQVGITYKGYILIDAQLSCAGISNGIQCHIIVEDENGSWSFLLRQQFIYRFLRTGSAQVGVYDQRFIYRQLVFFVRSAITVEALIFYRQC